MKGANRQMRMILMIFQKTFFLVEGGQMDHFEPKKFAQDKWVILDLKMEHP